MLNLSDDEEADATRVADALAGYEARRTIGLDTVPETLRPFVSSLSPLFMGEAVVAALPYALDVH